MSATNIQPTQSDKMQIAAAGFLAPGNMLSSRGMFVFVLGKPLPGLPASQAAQLIRDVLALEPTSSAVERINLPGQPGETIDTMAQTLAIMSSALLKGLGYADAQWGRDQKQPLRAWFASDERQVGEWALALASEAVEKGAQRINRALLRQLASVIASKTSPICTAAKMKGLSCRVVVPGDKPFYAVGDGHKRKLFWRTITPAISHVATVITTNKNLANTLMREAGLPVPAGMVVANADMAVKTAEALGYPVVIKPVGSDYGNGVAVGLTSETEVRLAYERAKEFGAVLVEEQIVGEQHRLFIVQGKCMTVSRLRPAHVVGDGIHTVAQLVALTNATRTSHLSAAGVKIKLDAAAENLLLEQGLTLGSTPTPGQLVWLRTNANLSTGGTGVNLTNETHPDVIAMAEKAAALFQMDVAGVDYITTDITRSPAQSNGAICEINVSPGLINMGEPVEIWSRILDEHFGHDSASPPVVVYLQNDSHGSADNILDELEAAFPSPASRTDRLHLRPKPGPAVAITMPTRVNTCLADPKASSVIVAARETDLKQTGLGLETCTLAIVSPGVSPAAILAMSRIARALIIPAQIADAFAQQLDQIQADVWIYGAMSQPIPSRATCVAPDEHGGLIISGMRQKQAEPSTLGTKQSSIAVAAARLAFDTLQSAEKATAPGAGHVYFEHDET